MSGYTLTTPIYYINDHPHLGTAYTTVLTDVLARYHRSRDEEVFFVTGTDENGEKIMRAAVDRGLTPRELVDTMSGQYRAAWKALDISYDRFIRTTDQDHVLACEQIFLALLERGDIYKDRYEGWYCVPCETFIVDAVEGKCPECGRPLERVHRDAYFFALSRYADRLLKYYEQHPDFVQPDFRRNEVVRFIQDGLRDMCITRDNNGWGIRVPGDPEHVLYVWFDALINYIAAAGYPDDPVRLKKYWPAALHVVGKDILVRFHATLWPAMLMGIGQPLPRQILAHGWLMINDRKMSKSLIEQQLAQWQQEGERVLKVTSLRPGDLVEGLRELAGIPEERRWVAVDALRYFLVRDLPAGADAEFSLERLVDRYNADLANDLGNLVNRTLSMLQRYRQSQTPAISGRHLQAVCTEAVDLAAAAYEGLQPTDALAQVSRIISAGNHTIDEQKPWNLQKTGQDAALDAVLYDCGEACRIAAVLVSPVMPSVAREILRQLGITSAPIRWADTAWSGWRPGSLALSPEPIFPRIDPKRKAAPAVLPVTAPVAAEKTPGENAADLSIEEFQRVQLRVATIKSAERVEGARKLLKLILDVGDHERQIISGIADVYEPEALVGRQIAVIVNLKPARIRGVDSYGMLLAADADGKAILLQPDSPVPPGSPIR